MTHPSNMLRRILVPALLLTSLIQGCASTSSVTTRYQAGVQPPLGSLTIAARTPEKQARHEYERACAAQFQAVPDVTSSAVLLPDWYEAGHRQLLGVMSTDALLVIDITPVLLSPMQLPPANALSQERLGPASGPAHNTWELGSNRRDGDAQPSPVFNLEARLVAADNTILWEGLVLTREANDLRAIARSQCRALAETLHKAALLP